MRTKEVPDFGEGHPGTVEHVFHCYRENCKERIARGVLADTALRRYDLALRVVASMILPAFDRLKSFGSYPVDGLTPRHGRLLLDRVADLRSPKSANFALGITSQAMNYGAELGLCGASPFGSIKRHRVEPVRVVAWTPEEQQAVLEAARRINRPVVEKVLRLASMVAQRPCDIIGLTGQNYNHRTQRLSFVMRKTRELVDMPLPEAAPFFVGLGPNEPWLRDEALGSITTPEEFRPLFREVREAAGVRADLWLADMRRTVLTRMHELGATEDELLDVSRHKNRQQLQTYIARTPRSSMGALDKLRKGQGGLL